MLNPSRPSQIVCAALVGAGVFLTACISALAVPEVPSAVHQVLVTRSVSNGGGDTASALVLVGVSTPARTLPRLVSGPWTTKLPEGVPALAPTWAPANARAPPVSPHRRI